MSHHSRYLELRRSYDIRICLEDAPSQVTALFFFATMYLIIQEYQSAQQKRWISVTILPWYCNACLCYAAKSSRGRSNR